MTIRESLFRETSFREKNHPGKVTIWETTVNPLVVIIWLYIIITTAAAALTVIACIDLSAIFSSGLYCLLVLTVLLVFDTHFSDAAYLLMWLVVDTLRLCVYILYVYMEGTAAESHHVENDHRVYSSANTRRLQHCMISLHILQLFSHFSAFSLHLW